MQIKPLAQQRNRPAALVLPGHRRMTVLTAHGRQDVTGSRAVEALLSQLGGSAHGGGYVCYVPAALTSLRHVSSATSWTLNTWRDRGTSMVHDPTGATFTSLRGALEECGAAPEDQWEALSEVLDWVGEYGVTPGSISNMAMQLFRASLSSSVTIGFDPFVSRQAFYGGRQEARVQTDTHGRAKVYEHMVSADIKSAYAHAMAQNPYGLSLRPVSPTTTLDPAVPGLAEARVDVPEGFPFGPLPRRLSTNRIQFPTGGPVDGVWPWVELAAARELGCVVTVRSAWAPRATLDLFGPWYRLVASADWLSPGAQTLAKAIRNSLWGQFAMNGESNGMTRWLDDAGRHEVSVAKDPRRMPHAWTTHIAAETASRVRTRLLLEGLYGGSGGGSPVHADTDGVVVRASRPLPSPGGGGPGHWRQKAAMRRVDIRGPQLYRWTCSDCAPSASMIGLSKGKLHEPWHYLAAGIPKGKERAWFDNQEAMIPVNHSSVFDIVIPGTHSLEHELVKELMKV